MTQNECLPYLTDFARIVAMQHAIIRRPGVTEAEVDQAMRAVSLAVLEFFHTIPASTLEDHEQPEQSLA